MHACMHDGASWCGQNGHWCGQRRGLSLSACVTLIVQKMKPASFEYYPTPRFKKRTIQIQSSAGGAMAAMRACARALPWWVLPRVACVPRPCPAAPVVWASNRSARASLTSAQTFVPCVCAGACSKCDDHDKRPVLAQHHDLQISRNASAHACPHPPALPTARPCWC